MTRIADRRSLVLSLWGQGLSAREIMAQASCTKRFVAKSLEWKRAQPGCADFGRRLPVRATAPAASVCECGDHAWAPVTKGFVTFVSTEDAYLIDAVLWSAHINRAGQVYAKRVEEGRTLYLHREIVRPPATHEVDHQNQNGLDNRRPNVRPATKQQNAFNRKKRPGCSSPYIGVSNANSEHRRGTLAKPWAARADGRALGYFATSREAAQARDAAVFTSRGEFANLNFPEGRS